LSTCKPSYCRDVYRPNQKCDNLYWYSEALKSVSTLAPLWTIDQVKIKKSKLLKKTKRPRVFTMSNSQIGCQSEFEYGSSENEPKGYSGEVTTPFDQSSLQRYRWVRYKDGSRWVFIARNDPNTPLVELRKTSSKDEFDIVFLLPSPPGWRLRNFTSPSSDSIDQSAQYTGRYPSVFSNPSTYRSSATSGFISSRESSSSDEESESSENSRLFSTYENKFSFLNNQPRYDSYDFSDDLDSERHWQEFVLASTVTVQDEVNSNKRRLWQI